MRCLSFFALIVVAVFASGCPDDGSADAGAATGGDTGGTKDVVSGSDIASGADVAVAGDADTSAAPGDTSTGPDASGCEPGGFCRPMAANSCGDPAFGADPSVTCTLDGGGEGYCCQPLVGCTTDSDCPGCELCSKPGAGPGICVDPTVTVGPLCSAVDPCAAGTCCSFAALTKPECGGLCVPDDGTADCKPCMGEGGPVNVGSVVTCCAGLEAIDTKMTLPDGTCEPSRCLDCQVCVKGCGDGACTAGEDSCNCPADCQPVTKGAPGDPCTTNEDCASPGAGCLPEASGYPTGGYCTGGICDPGEDPTTCPAGTSCFATLFAQAYLCLPTCKSDGDCREGLTCEALSEKAPSHGGYICWESGNGKPNAMLGLALGETCDKDDDCISELCLAHPVSGDKVCSAFCNTETPCKASQTCNPMGGCGSPGCGGCFTM